MNRRDLAKGFMGAAAAIGGVASNVNARAAQRTVGYAGYPYERDCCADAADVVESAARTLLRKQAMDAERRALTRSRRRQRLRSMSDAAREAYDLIDEHQVQDFWRLFHDDQRRGA